MSPLSNISLAQILQAQHGHLFPWVPVAMAVGIGLYFSVKFEPSVVHFGAVALGGMICIASAVLFPPTFRPFLVGMCLVAFGFSLAGLKADRVSGPILKYRYYGPVEGRIVGIDRSHSDRVRITLDHVSLDRVPPHRTPTRVRLALHGEQNFVDLQPGLWVGATGHLSPPQGPSEPGGFDFQRHAWFARLGAVGYTRVPVLAMAEPQGSSLVIFKVRRSLSLWMQDKIPGENGAFAAAIVTGDRSGMGQASLDDLRASNLAHLLAISGLHMGLLTAFVFAALRYGFALIPWVALRWPVKKIAAIWALAVATVYLALSGGNVATERAYVMVAVMLVAIMLDRRALTLRAVAMAAVIILALHPEALIGPGFQMSFAATTALVAVFGALRHVEGWPTLVPNVLKPFVALVLSSAVAGLATAPIGAAHFNQIAHYGLLANILSVPMMGTIVVPAAVVTALLFPIGLEAIGLWVMEQGIAWILGVSHWVANLEAATSHVPSPQTWVLALLTLGALFVVLWQGRTRGLGVAVMALGFGAWMNADRPVLLVSDGGALLGVMTSEGRAVSRAKGQGFAARSWLENDGDPVPQLQSFARDGFIRAEKQNSLRLNETEIAQFTGKTASLEAASACGAFDIVIIERAGQSDGTCALWDRDFFRENGSVAIYERDEGLRIVTARQHSGTRHWNLRAKPSWTRSKSAKPSQ